MQNIPNPRHVMQGQEVLDLATAVAIACKVFVGSISGDNPNSIIETAIDLNKKLGDLLWIISLHNQENRKEKK